MSALTSRVENGNQFVSRCSISCFVTVKMDPLSICSSVATIVLNSAKLAKSFHELKASYTGSSDTVAAICRECSLAHLALSQVQSIITKDTSVGIPDTRRHPFSGIFTELVPILDSLDAAISKLDDEAVKIQIGLNRTGSHAFTAKLDYLWNEDRSKPSC